MVGRRSLLISIRLLWLARLILRLVALLRLVVALVLLLVAVVVSGPIWVCENERETTDGNNSGDDYLIATSSYF